MFEREGEVLKGGRESRSNPVRLKPPHTFLLSVHRVLLKIDRLADSRLTNPHKMNSFCHSQSCHFALKRDEESNCSYIGVFCSSFDHDVLETNGFDMPPLKVSSLQYMESNCMGPFSKEHAHCLPSRWLGWLGEKILCWLEPFSLYFV